LKEENRGEEREFIVKSGELAFSKQDTRESVGQGINGYGREGVSLGESIIRR
jgi:hypothetical protein